MTATARTVQEAEAMIRAAGLTPISSQWYIDRGIEVSGVGSVETWGPGTYNHGKMYVSIER